MRILLRNYLGVVSCLGSLLACADRIPTAVDSNSPVLRQESIVGRPLSLDERYAEIADAVPGFGGMYVDSSGTVILALKPKTKKAAARDAVRPLLSVNLRSYSGRPISIERSKVKEVKYDFRELFNWRRSLHALQLDRFGVDRLDIDERLNRISLAVRRPEETEVLLGAISALGIPSDAIDIRVRPAMARLTTLANYSGSKKGGIRITNSVYAECTLGFNLYFTAGESYRGFVTASHCTETQGGTEGTYFYQPTLSGPNQIGIEIADPAFTYTGTDCPDFSYCRYSDAALVSYDLGPVWAGATLARTEFNGTTSGSVDISTTNPEFTVTGVDIPVVGTRVDKMGVATGWTWGIVQGTCVDYSPAGLPSNYYLLCQYETDFGAIPGDSGSPVFIWGGGSTVPLVGILWGQGDGFAAFSGYSDVRYELGYTPWQISGF